jgi:hypothetical protein
MTGSFRTTIMNRISTTGASLVPLQVILPRFWVASTKPEAALGRSQASTKPEAALGRSQG